MIQVGAVVRTDGVVFGERDDDLAQQLADGDHSQLDRTFIELYWIARLHASRPVAGWR